MRLITVNAADSATLNATPAMVSTLPVANLQTQYREQLARTVGTSTQLIEMAWATPVPLSAFVLYRGNFSGSARWQVQVYADATMADLLYDSGAAYASAPKTLGDLIWGVDALGATFYDDWGYTISALWFAPVIGKYARITLSDPANPDSYMQASRLFAGAYVETAHAPELGAAMGWQETSVQTRTEGGTLRTEPGSHFRTLEITTRLLPENDRVRLSDLFRQTGLRGDLYVSIFPELGGAVERDHQMQGKLVKLAPTAIPVYARYDQPFSIEEI